MSNFHIIPETKQPRLQKQ